MSITGHAAGDWTIRLAAQRIQRGIRADKDWVARLGGDEFLICLNNASQQQAGCIAERIRQDIADICLPEGDRGAHSSSVSMGIHTMLGTPLAANVIIHLSGCKRYEAKRAGKNCVAIGSSGRDPPADGKAGVICQNHTLLMIFLL